MKLITLNTPGNVHESAIYLNKAGVADFVLSIEFINMYHSVVVLKIPDEDVEMRAKQFGLNARAIRGEE